MKWLAAVGCGALALTVISTSCGPQQPAQEASLTLKASPREIKPDGTATTITVTATDNKGQPGTGTVTLSAPAGTFDTSAIALVDGTGSAKFSCDASKNSDCTGNVRISGDWSGTTGATTVTLTASGDGGMQMGDGGMMSGGDGGTKIAVASARSPIFVSVGDSTVITASLTTADGGAIAGETVQFATTLGGFGAYPLPDGGAPVPQTMTSAQTDSTGKAKVTFLDNGVPGSATITASHETSGASATTTVEISRVQQITWDKTKCNNIDCTVMGIQGSGFNELANVSFKVTDVTGKPVEGVTVHFDIPMPPSGTTVGPGNPASAVTDATGIAVANVTAGPTRGAFTVHAVVVAGQIETQSPTIGIRGAKPANQGFNFYCNPVNLGAYVSPTPPAAYTIDCNFALVDRSNNPVGTGTNVGFLTEAGKIPTFVASTAFLPTGDNSKEGTGNLKFNTTGGTFPAVDVAPLPADANQFPNPRTAEPSWQDGAITRNPRDGLVTIIAYVRGEEFFTDDNNNGKWDPGEKFIDQGEAFVDANDNGVYDVGEQYIDDSPADNKWNGPNGTYDSDKTVWAETHVLFTGRPDVNNTYALPDPYAPACPNGLGKGLIQNVQMYFGDLNKNRVQAAGTGFQTKHTAQKGQVAWIGGSQFLDGYGFGLERILVDSSQKRSCEMSTAGVCNNTDPLPGTACTPTSSRCEWKTKFYVSGTGKTFFEGYAGDMQITGAAVSDMTGCQSDVATTTATVLQAGTDLSVPGALQ